jgi:hypothetical protein
MTGYSYLLDARDPECCRNNNKNIIPDTRMNLTTILIISIIFSSLSVITIVVKNPIASYIFIVGNVAFVILIACQTETDSDSDSDSETHSEIESEIESESESECDDVPDNKSPKEKKDD